MGLFSQSEEEVAVDSATTSLNTSENWAKILEVCDKAGKKAEVAKTYLKLIVKKLNDADPHIQVQAATLLDACVKNSGRVFLLEVASSPFENEYCKLVMNGKCHPDTLKKLKESLKKWTEGEFKNDPELGLIPSLYHKLQSKGVSFPSESHQKKVVHLSKDPNVVQSQDEEDQIAKAIELSLNETSNKSPRVSSSNPITTTTTSSTLYPTNMLTSGGGGGSSAGGGTAASTASSTAAVKEPRKVRALYDFEAAEDNELTFVKGELILVLDDSDTNWWRGSNHRGEGLFPSNFVTSDLSAEPELDTLSPDQDSKSLDEVLEEKLVLQEPENVVINEAKIDRLLHLLHEADPTDPMQDTKEMLNLEKEVNVMGPMIDAELERVDRKHAQLTQLSTDLVDAMNLYHSLMREPPLSMKAQFPGYPQAPQTMIYNDVGAPPSLAHFSQQSSMMMGPQQQQQHNMYSLPPDAIPGRYVSMPGPLPSRMHQVPVQQRITLPQPQQPLPGQAQGGHLMGQQGQSQQQQLQVAGMLDEQQQRLVQQQPQQQSQGGFSVPQQFSPPPHHGGLNMAPASFNPLPPMNQNAIMNGPPQGATSVPYSAMSQEHIM